MDFSSLTPLPGGWSGATFLAEAGGERSVVRIYAAVSERGPVAHEVDAALLHLVRGLVPVPEVLEVVPADIARERPALLVTSYVEGARADVLLPTLDEAGRRSLGATLGGLVADLGGMPQLRWGPFLDATLRLGSFGDLDGQPAWVQAQEPRLVHLSSDELDGLRQVALDAQTLLDTVTRVCLVHSDLNPKNLLVDPETLAVTALVDWEFAHAGHPYTDLGNLLRFERDPDFTQAVLDAYAARRAVSSADALALARAADLWALVELAGRRHDNPVAARADRLLRAIAWTRDATTPGPDPGSTHGTIAGGRR
ncbi:MAG: phosphotransferase [Nocardioides sp.]|nr:phosphotransferase [Nocardioides sp.]